MNGYQKIAKLPIIKITLVNIKHNSSCGNIVVWPIASLLLPRLVLDNFREAPPWPFDVARTAESIVAVLLNFVTAVVAKVAVVSPTDSENALSVRNTSAAPGAGT